MDGDEEEMLVLGKPNEASANERTACKVEGIQQLFFYQPMTRAFSSGFRQFAQVNEIQR